MVGTRTDRQIIIDGTETDAGFLDCPYCENTLHYFDGEVDHIEPWSRGGSRSKENLILICKECNKKKRDMPLHIYCYSYGITPESVYLRLKRAGKNIPASMLTYLGYDA